MEPVDPAPQPRGNRPEGRSIGKYLVLEELGQGAQGIVFLAEDTQLRRKVALKMLGGSALQSKAARDRFQREAELASKLDHPGICGVHEVGEVDGVPFIAMQYVRGATVADLLEKAVENAGAGADSPTRGTLTLTGRDSKGDMHDLLRLLERAARALHVAHEAGLVHRDIKPGNIMVTEYGHPILLDFGLARDVDGQGQTLTQSGQIMGTPAYLAPEQIVAERGGVDRRTDVYALGVTLFECLTLTRPFDGGSWDQLFHTILHGAPPNPRKLNPRIPQDLRTIIEVAMDRDPERRYPTALVFAEELRRVRFFEPIKAKAAGPVTRLRKWAQRSPGKAASAAAVVLFLMVGSGFLVVQAHETRRAVADNVARAEERLQAGDLTGALEAIAQALERDPESTAALTLKAGVETEQVRAQAAARRQADLAAAAEAVEQAEGLREQYFAARRRMETLRKELLRDRSEVFERFAPDAVRSAYAQKEVALQELEMDAERILLAYDEALQRAARRESAWGELTDATRRASADYAMQRWREAMATEDRPRAMAMRTVVERYDKERRYQEELEGRGTVTVTSLPADAELFLFRYEPYETVREDGVIPRLVPVPTGGIGRLRPGAWHDRFHPGDVCLRISEVADGSPASEAGLRAGDLVVKIGGYPAANSLLVREVPDAGPLAQAGVRPGARILTLQGLPIDVRFDWTIALSQDDAGMQIVRIDGVPDEIACDPKEIATAKPLDLLDGDRPFPIEVLCLRNGAPLTLALQTGQPSGIACERTAYPLICCDGNEVETGRPIACDPGSYLLLGRYDDRMDQRLPFTVARRQDVSLTVELLPESEVPPGFVHVPPGPVTLGGDPKALFPRPARTEDLPGFFIAREEVTNGQYFEFLNDEETLAKIAAAPEGNYDLLPRETDRPTGMVRKLEDGSYTWNAWTYTTERSPVLGLSWDDVRAYVDWRNRRAEAAGEPWRYDLPSEAEWEKAARGADGRYFPWGNRFDPSLAVTLLRKQKGVYLLDVPGGFEPRDESPYGVLDMGGSCEEFLRDRVPGTNPVVYRRKGGRWSSYVSSQFRAASRMSATHTAFSAAYGFRLVARTR